MSLETDAPRRKNTSKSDAPALQRLELALERVQTVERARTAPRRLALLEQARLRMTAAGPLAAQRVSASLDGIAGLSAQAAPASSPAAALSAAAADSQPGSIRDIPCDQCGERQFLTLFEKPSAQGEIFRVVRCLHCELVQVNPQPDAAAVRPYYEAHYFSQRTDRGYDNYFSPQVKAVINETYRKNLDDLGFFDYEEQIQSDSWIYRHCGETGAAEAQPPRALDVGCAAGYFVEYLRDRGWRSEGVELSAAAARFGIEELHLPIHVDDFLTCRKLPTNSYQLVTLWASIEHLHSPRQALQRCYELLAPGGRMLLSTCRWGALAKWRGPAWRFMNTPEHLYFFSLEGLRDLAESIGFKVANHVSYGSGFTTRKDAGPLYRLAKRIADPLVKRLDQGDMMALHLMK